MSGAASYTCHTPEQKRAKADFEALVADLPKADAAYNALSETDGGKIVSTDLVRYLDQRYANVPAGTPRDLAPSWAGAWRYAQERLQRELLSRGHRKVVRFMAGGWASGKTHIVEFIRGQKTDGADLVWDGTLKDQKWATDTIRLALAHGWLVDIVYVHRNIELALYGAIERGRSDGRYVPLTELPGNHRDVQRSIRALIRKFENESNVSFRLFHNTGTEKIPGVSIVIPEDALAPHGPLHYSSSYERYYQDAAGQIHAFTSA